MSELEKTIDLLLREPMSIAPYILDNMPYDTVKLIATISAVLDLVRTKGTANAIRTANIP